MPDNCRELKSLLDQVTDREVPVDLRELIETHLESCRACRTDFNRFLKIGNILQRTVYSNPSEDKYIAYLSHLAGRRLRWGSQVSQAAPPQERRRMGLLLLKVFAGFLGAAAVGASLALILGHFGVFSRGAAPPAILSVDTLFSSRPAQPGAVAPPGNPAETAGLEDSVVFHTPDTLTPEAVAAVLEREENFAAATGKPSTGDSTRLRVLLAEQTALRDALSRTPGDAALVRRAVDKGREVIAERRLLGRAERVSDYYNLGYAHYLGHEYRQAVLVTTDGLQSVTIGPTEYLHYLKAMSHFRLAERMLQPLPADTSSTEPARLRGVLMRSELDSEARTRAVGELRRSIAEFSFLLNRPELEPVARNWILELNQRIAAVSGP